jgi:hypothetical protein
MKINPPARPAQERVVLKFVIQLFVQHFKSVHFESFRFVVLFLLIQNHSTKID